MQKDKKKSFEKNSVDKNGRKRAIDTDIVSLIKGLKKAESNLKESDSLKKPRQKSEIKKEPELEEDVELDLGDMEFHSLMKLSQPSEGKTPVLERVAREAQRPIFVGGGIRQDQNVQTDSKDKNGDDSFKYVPSNTEKTEPKYVESSTQIYREAEIVDINRVGRKQGPFSPANQEAFFTQSSEAKSDSHNQERLFRVDRFEVEKAGRKNPFERDEVKYEKYKPRSSR